MGRAELGLAYEKIRREKRQRTAKPLSDDYVASRPIVASPVKKRDSDYVAAPVASSRGKRKDTAAKPVAGSVSPAIAALGAAAAAASYDRDSWSAADSSGAAASTGPAAPAAGSAAGSAAAAAGVPGTAAKATHFSWSRDDVSELLFSFLAIADARGADDMFRLIKTSRKAPAKAAALPSATASSSSSSSSASASSSSASSASAASGAAASGAAPLVPVPVWEVGSKAPIGYKLALKDGVWQQVVDTFNARSGKVISITQAQDKYTTLEKTFAVWRWFTSKSSMGNVSSTLANGEVDVVDVRAGSVLTDAMWQQLLDEHKDRPELKIFRKVNNEVYWEYAEPLEMLQGIKGEHKPLNATEFKERSSLLTAQRKKDKATVSAADAAAGADSAAAGSGVGAASSSGGLATLSKKDREKMLALKALFGSPADVREKNQDFLRQQLREMEEKDEARIAEARAREDSRALKAQDDKKAADAALAVTRKSAIELSTHWMLRGAANSQKALSMVLKLKVTARIWACSEAELARVVEQDVDIAEALHQGASLEDIVQLVVAMTSSLGAMP